MVPYSIIADLFCYLTAVSWCGWIINANGLCFLPCNIVVLNSCDQPQSACEYFEYVYGLNWISFCIPRFPKRVASVHEMLQTADRMANWFIKMKTVARIHLSTLRWDDSHCRPLKDLRTQIMVTTWLALRSKSKVLCFLTNAAKRH